MKKIQDWFLPGRSVRRGTAVPRARSSRWNARYARVLGSEFKTTKGGILAFQFSHSSKGGARRQPAWVRSRLHNARQNLTALFHSKLIHCDSDLHHTEPSGVGTTKRISRSVMVQGKSAAHCSRSCPASDNESFPHIRQRQ